MTAYERSLKRKRTTAGPRHSASGPEPKDEGNEFVAKDMDFADYIEAPVKAEEDS